MTLISALGVSPSHPFWPRLYVSLAGQPSLCHLGTFHLPNFHLPTFHLHFGPCQRHFMRLFARLFHPFLFIWLSFRFVYVCHSFWFICSIVSHRHHHYRSPGARIMLMMMMIIIIRGAQDCWGVVTLPTDPPDTSCWPTLAPKHWESPIPVNPWIRGTWHNPWPLEHPDTRGGRLAIEEPLEDRDRA